ncbi:hypothetical protein AYI68_g5186 [Smittium mucronatum]|uniref:Uncharacterized protein n=1 Tax=Smittium mucronatum TaxID=133383 RepID=A0A1R0GV02_9FUNG|nr:hypothetical protein AYI68_g5186 [Smittium mucronatum]
MPLCYGHGYEQPLVDRVWFLPLWFCSGGGLLEEFAEDRDSDASASISIEALELSGDLDSSFKLAKNQLWKILYLIYWDFR